MPAIVTLTYQRVAMEIRNHHMSIHDQLGLKGISYIVPTN